MNAADVPVVLAAVALAAPITTLTFFILSRFKNPSTTTLLSSAAAFPALVTGLAIYISRWLPEHDPHGFIMVALLVLALLSLPVTIITATILASSPLARSGDR